MRTASATPALLQPPPLPAAPPQANHPAVRAFLWRLVLDSPDANISSAASALLAKVHARQLRSILGHPASPRSQQPPLAAWLTLLGGDTAERLDQLRKQALLPPVAPAAPAAQGAVAAAAAEEEAAAAEGAAAGAADVAAGGQAGAAAPAEQAAVAAEQWWQPPAVLAQPGASAEELEAAALHCQRILKYLATLVEECQVSNGLQHTMHVPFHICCVHALGAALVLPASQLPLPRTLTPRSLFFAMLAPSTSHFNCSPFLLQGRRMPSPPAHRSSWRGFPMTVTVQLPTVQVRRAWLSSSWLAVVQGSWCCSPGMFWSHPAEGLCSGWLHFLNAP